MNVTERSTREDLAALYRLVHLMRIDHRIFNHHSARIPGDDDHILINPFGLLQDEITADTLIKVDRDGQAIDGAGADANRAGAIIHWAVYDARDDVRCIVHHHSAAAVAVSALDGGLLPLSQGAMQFYNRIGYHDYEGMVFSDAEKPRLAASLGPYRLMLLRHHGALVCGRSIAECFVLTDDLEKACRSQLLAMQSGGPLVLPSPDLCEHTAAQFEALPQPRGERLDWPAALRRLDRLGIDYKGG